MHAQSSAATELCETGEEDGVGGTPADQEERPSMGAVDLRSTRRNYVGRLIDRMRRLGRRRFARLHSIDPQVAHLRHRVDANSTRLTELETVVLDRSACAHERLRAVETRVDQMVAVLDRMTQRS